MLYLLLVRAPNANVHTSVLCVLNCSKPTSSHEEIMK